MLTNDVLLPGQYLPAPALDPMCADRTEFFFAELLTPTEQVVRTLGEAKEFSLTLNANATLRTGGTLNCELLDDIPMNHRVRLWWSVEGIDPWPLGVYLIDADSTGYSATSSRPGVLTLTDKMALLEGGPTGAWSQPAGTNRTTIIKDILAGLGEARAVVVASPDTLSNMYVAEPDANWLQIINDIRPANYWSIYTDRTGTFRMEPYVDPSDRGVAWTFAEGDTALHVPVWAYNSRKSQIPNFVKVSNQPGDETPVLIATWVNQSDGPTSIDARGRVIPAPFEEVDVPNLAALQKYVDDKGARLSRLAALIEGVQHAQVPVWYNEVVHFVSQGVDVHATVREMSMSSARGASVLATWEVI